MNGKDSITNVVRNYARVMHLFTRKQAVIELGLDINQVTHAINTLKVSGDIKPVKFGLYTWVQSRTHAPVASVIHDKVWRAIKINPVFTSHDLARQAGVSVSYAARKIKDYRNTGLIEQAGIGRSSDNAPIRKWRLTTAGQKNIDRPCLVEFEPDPLIERAVTLNKLICTGVAIRMDVDRKRAIALCDEIKTILNGGEPNAENI